MYKYGDEERITAISHLAVTAAWDGWDNPTKRAMASYDVTIPGWVVVETKTEVHRSSGSFEHSVSVVGPGAKLIYEEDFKRVYESAMEIAGELGDDALKGQIQDRMNDHETARLTYESKNNTIVAHVEATPHGSFIDRMRSWVDISVEARIRYIASPDPNDLAEELALVFSLPRMPMPTPNPVELRAHSGQGLMVYVSPSSELLAVYAQAVYNNPVSVFELIELGNSQIALRANNGKYVRAVDGGELRADTRWIKEHETFKAIAIEGRVFALQAHNGDYVRVGPVDDTAHANKVLADSSQIGESESFRIGRR
jgi:hypothetical protein